MRAGEHLRRQSAGSLLACRRHEQAIALGLALEIAIREIHPTDLEHDPAGWEKPGIQKWKWMLAGQVGDLEFVHAKIIPPRAR